MSENTLISEIALGDLDLKKLAHHLGIPTKISVSNPVWTSESPSDITPTLVEPLTDEVLLNRVKKAFRSHTANFLLTFMVEQSSSEVTLTDATYANIQEELFQKVKVTIK